METEHRAGFVNIMGKPNVGKSTLLNRITGEKLSIVTPKAQTTRHRIKAIVSKDNFQVIFSDTPGIIEPAYLLQNKMMGFVQAAMKDADLLVFMANADDAACDAEILACIKSVQIPCLIVLNKADLVNQEQLTTLMETWRKGLQEQNLSSQVKEIVPVSAKVGFNTEVLLNLMVSYLPVSPAYFPKDQITDLPERFFVAEIIREKILLYYKQEIPYSVEVVITSMKRDKKLIRIHAEIITERQSQKGILIGPGGIAMKQVGTQARKGIEQFLKSHVYLELLVKVKPDWRKKENMLRDFGYDSEQ